jgi:hypothetical protein
MVIELYGFILIMQLCAYYGVTFKVMNDLLIIKEETEFFGFLFCYIIQVLVYFALIAAL